MKAPDQRMKENSIIVLTERRRKNILIHCWMWGHFYVAGLDSSISFALCGLAPNFSRVPGFLSSLRLGFRQSQTHKMNSSIPPNQCLFCVGRFQALASSSCTEVPFARVETKLASLAAS